MTENTRPLTQNEIEVAWTKQLLERRGWTALNDTITPTVLTVSFLRHHITAPPDADATEIQYATTLLSRRGWRLAAKSESATAVTIILSRDSIPEPSTARSIARDLY